ncbi:MAG TPA: carbohydrate-binding protein [Gemmatimonadales bacterium]|nr:carbohydrate-binding protein [Gemmatimonadales bacterium]
MLRFNRTALVRQTLSVFVIGALLCLGAIPLGIRGDTPETAHAATLPERPRVLLDTAYVPPSGRTIAVPAGGDFQAALNTAQRGDVITLQAGATYSGSFTLPAKDGTGWITIRSSAADGVLPPPGRRITPAHAPLMPKIVGSPALTAPSGAQSYRLVGVEFRPPTGVAVMTLIAVNGSRIVLDRSYIHGDPLAGGRLGVALNGSSNAVIDSHLSDWKHLTYDSQAIQSWNGPGPYKIVNNYLEASGENILVGGTDASSSANWPSDIEVRGNHLFKPLVWKVGDAAFAGSNWVVKNLFELKNARRVLIEGNVFENNWTGNAQSQGGLAIVFTPRNQGGGNLWAAVEDVTFIRNIVRASTAGIFFLGWDDLKSSQQLRRVLVQDNLFVDIGVFPDVLWNFFTGMLFFMKNGPADIVIDHNTALQTGYPLYGQDQAGRGPTTGLVFTNNIMRATRGVGGAGSTLSSLDTYFTGALVIRNALTGGKAADYPGDNFFPAAVSDVGFTDLALGDYSLAPASLYKHQATDGKDLGADFGSLLAATATTVSGETAGETVDAAPPVISAVTVSGLTTSEATITWATNEPASAQVEYGTTTGYGTASAPSAVGSVTHTVVLSGLAAGTPYHFRVRSGDAAGNLATSGDYTLATAAPVVLQSPFRGSPIAVPGQFEAEDFDIGGEAAAYHDNVRGNAGGAYRTDVDVDIFLLSNGAHAVRNFETGEWLEYTIAVSKSGTYRLEILAANAAWSPTPRWHAEIDGAPVTGSLSVPSTGAWSTYQWTGTGGIALTAGRHVLRIVADQQYFDLAAVRIAGRRPFKGTPWAVPGQIEAEDFDEGGEAVAYHDNVRGNAGGAYRTDVDVDIFTLYNGALAVRNLETGEWLEYTIAVSETAVYRLEILAANAAWSPAPRWHAEIDGLPITGSLNVPSTDAWSTYQWSGAGGITLTAGQHVLRIAADQQYFDLAALRVVR